MPPNEQHVSTEQQFVPLTYVGPYVLPILEFLVLLCMGKGLDNLFLSHVLMKLNTVKIPLSFIRNSSIHWLHISLILTDALNFSHNCQWSESWSGSTPKIQIYFFFLFESLLSTYQYIFLFATDAYS